MSIRLTDDTDPQAAAREHLPALRRSPLRARQIKDYLTSLGLSEDATVECDPEAPTASIKQDAYEEAPTVILPTEIFDDIPGVEEKIAARLGQYSAGIHETGHDLYTDLPYLKREFDRRGFDDQYHDLFWDLLNALSDHRIEKALIRSGGESVRKRLRWVNKHIVQTPVDERPARIRHNTSWDVALHTASIHYGKAQEEFDFIPALEDTADDRVMWWSDEDREFYEKVLPKLRETLEAVGNEPDPKAAVDRAIQFVSWLDDELNDGKDIDPPEPDDEGRQHNSGDSRLDSQDYGGAKQEADSLGDDSESGAGDDDDVGDGDGDADNSASSAEPGGTDDGATDDDASEEASGGQDSDGQQAETGEAGASDQGEDAAGEADGADDDAAVQPESGERGGTGKPEHNEDDADAEGAASHTEDGDATGEPATDEGTDNQSDLSEFVEEERRRVGHEEQRLDAQRRQLESELERMTDALAAGGGNARKLVLPQMDGVDGDPDTWGQIRHTAERINFRALSANQRGEFQRGIQAGKLDPSRAAKLLTGNLGVCRRERIQSEKDYAVVLVLDRSGSMGAVIEEAEVAIGSLALALESEGVSTCIIDLYRSESRLVKPFGEGLRTARNAITSHQVGGGTPLSDTLAVARERVLQESSQPFMIVVGDGKPHDSDAYRAELKRTPFPVMGVTIGTKDLSNYFTAHRNTTAERIEETLVSLAEEGLR